MFVKRISPCPLKSHHPSPPLGMDLQQTITIKEVLTDMGSGQPFAIEYCSYDKKRGTGGELINLSNCTHPKRQQSPTTGDNRGKVKNHYANATRNIYPQEGHPIPVHIYLITKFNHKTVVL